MIRTKICGVCRPEDAAFAADRGADYIGVILARGGGRSQTVEAAAEIFAAADGAGRVGVFLDDESERVLDAARTLDLSVVQLHGAESAGFAASIGEAGPWRVWKALRPRSGAALLDGIAAYGRAVDGIVLDGWSASGAGGTGTRFPWDEVAAVRGRMPPGLRFVAAGGLTPENVADAVGRLSPDAVDVSSGVERAVGEKALEQVEAFIERAREAGRAPERSEAEES